MSAKIIDIGEYKRKKLGMATEASETSQEASEHPEHVPDTQTVIAQLNSILGPSSETLKDLFRTSVPRPKS